MPLLLLLSANASLNFCLTSLQLLLCYNLKMAHRVGLCKETGTFGKHFLQIFIVNHHTHPVQVLINFFILPATNRTLSFESFSLYKYPSPIPCWWVRKDGNAAFRGYLAHTWTKTLPHLLSQIFSYLHTSFFVHITTYKYHKPHFLRHTPIIINLFIFYMLPTCHIFVQPLQTCYILV